MTTIQRGFKAKNKYIKTDCAALESPLSLPSSTCYICFI